MNSSVKQWEAHISNGNKKLKKPSEEPLLCSVLEQSFLLVIIMTELRNLGISTWEYIGMSMQYHVIPPVEE